jgi:transcriptional regulator of heat shock response
MNKHETILSVDEATKEVMDFINKEVCEAIANSLGENLRSALKPVKTDIEGLVEKMQLDLKNARKTIEKVSADSQEQLAKFQNMLLESQRETAEKVDEVLKAFKKTDQFIQQGLANQTAMLEAIAKIQEDMLYLKQPFFKKIFNKEDKKR